VSPESPSSRLVLIMMGSHYKQKLQIAEQKNEEYVGSTLDIVCLLTILLFRLLALLRAHGLEPGQ
jgi:hypothetical protein